MTRSGGRITVVIRKTTTPDGETAPDARIVFEYYDTSVDPARYSLMINAHIMEEGNNFYIYNWY